MPNSTIESMWVIQTEDGAVGWASTKEEAEKARDFLGYGHVEEIPKVTGLYEICELTYRKHDRRVTIGTTKTLQDEEHVTEGSSIIVIYAGTEGRCRELLDKVLGG